jgi:hypothetical protein
MRPPIGNGANPRRKPSRQPRVAVHGVDGVAFRHAFPGRPRDLVREGTAQPDRAVTPALKEAPVRHMGAVGEYPDFRVRLNLILD